MIAVSFLPTVMSTSARPLRCSSALPALLGVALLHLAGANAVQAQNTSLTSTVAESGLTQNLFAGPPESVGNLTSPGTPFTFAGSTSLISIQSFTLTLSIVDGDSAMGEVDFNSLNLRLDTVNTGLLLNGFRGAGLSDTLTFNFTPSAAVASALLTDLQADGQLNAFVVDSTGTALQGNEMEFNNLNGDASTTLVINGTIIPEPATVGLLGVGLLAGAVTWARRRRRA